MSLESSRLAAAFQATLPQFRETERRRTYYRSEQRRIQDNLATLSGRALDHASQEEDEEQKNEEDCLEQVSAPNMLPPERGRRKVNFRRSTCLKYVQPLDKIILQHFTSECPTVRKSIAACNKMELIFLH